MTTPVDLSNRKREPQKPADLDAEHNRYVIYKKPPLEFLEHSRRSSWEFQELNMGASRNRIA